ncbi:ABC transporter permease subunit [Planosporangium sp. 12N6]|uniref:ABC transporter permease subunit n=1 Tax=Planosporangium spinosum TaxID=3402278 RepID=UPI003CEE7B32
MLTSRTTATGLVAKILLLGLVAALAVWAAFPLVQARAWAGLAVEVAVVALIFYAYLTPRRLPLKYLLPGTLFLVAFQIVPVLNTMGTAFSNFGDGHRGTKQDAITAIQTASVVEVPGAPEYALKVLDGADGAIAFLLTDPAGKQFLGDAHGLKPVDGIPDGYTPLSLGEAGARSREITDLVVPTSGGAIRSSGISRAYEGRAQRSYHADCDCIVDAATGHRWTARDGSFVDSDGQRLPQGWRITVGLRNFTQVVTDSRIARPFFGTLAWNLVFAVASVLTTFALGMLCALALHSDRVRGRTIYRALLVLPYAMPSFAMLLVWRDMFNADFGLINRLSGLSVDWLGTPWTARFAVIGVQLWLGYPYMFLVATGALQAIPREMTEAASMDGASPWQAFRRVTLPLLLVALSPLLISSFAYNFNNFNAIYLTTEGGPFPADDPTAGATDLLITYTYRLAFGGAGARYGFAAAISVYIFTIVAVISAVSFRRTRRQEEVYS